MQTTEPTSFFSTPVKPGDKLMFWFRNIAFIDWLMFIFLSELLLAVFFVPSGQRAPHLTVFAGMWVAFAVVVGVLVRGNILPDSWLKAITYRAALMGATVGAYSAFRTFLPALHTGGLDAELIALDQMLFGGEPTYWFDQFVSPATTEWFSFFYISYFIIIAAHVFPIIFASRNQQWVSEVSLGIAVICCAGHTFYMLVPGFGPYHATPELFQNQFPSGFWYDFMSSTVAAGGAQKDIFPSLHTALPLFLFLFNFRYRAILPFRYTAPVAGFFSLNIIISTMFLRWHYLIDVVAGVALAFAAYFIATRVTAWEARNRQAMGIGDAWPMPPR